MDDRASPRWHGGRCHRGFTLTELLTVLGLVALLIALFLPIVGRVRTTAAAAACLSNLKQMGTAWTMSLAEDHGRLIDYAWYTPRTPDLAWNGYWVGAIERQRVGDKTLCPSAPEPLPTDATLGYGTAAHAWTGRYSPNGTAIHFNADTYRQGSYGYNRWLSASGGFGAGGGAVFLADLAGRPDVPVFMDCAYADVRPLNGSAATPAEAPPDLSGRHAAPGNPEHWKFTLARHGRGINVYRTDGSAAWVRLEELYLLSWRGGWSGYRLDLPRE